jgi:hypothetical protein
MKAKTVLTWFLISVAAGVVVSMISKKINKGDEKSGFQKRIS